MATARSKHKTASGVIATAESYGVSPLHSLRRHRQQKQEEHASRVEAERVARIRQTVLKQHMDSVAATGCRAETAAGDEADAEEELHRWRRRHRRQAPIAQLMTALFPAMAQSGVPAADTGPAGSMVGFLDGGRQPTMVPVAAASPGSTSGFFSISNLSHSRQAGASGTHKSGFQGGHSSPQHPLPPAPPGGALQESVSFEEQVEELRPGAAQQKVFNRRQPDGHPVLPPAQARGGGSSASEGRSGGSHQQANRSSMATVHPPRSWARVAYRRPRGFNPSQRPGLLASPTQDQLDNMFIQGRTVIAHYCVIPEPPSIKLTLPRRASTSRAGTDGGSASPTTTSSAGGQSEGVHLQVELCEMYPQFDRLNVVANRIMGLNHMAGAKLYTTPFKADIRLPSGSQMTLFMPVLGPLDPPYARQAVHALRRDAGFGVGHAWAASVRTAALAQYVLEAAHAKAEKGQRAPTLGPQDILNAITDHGGISLPGSVQGGSAEEGTPRTSQPLKTLDCIASGMAHTGLGFLGGRCTPEAFLGYWRNVESKVQGQLSQSLLKWSMGIPLGQSSKGTGSRNGRMTGLEVVLPTRPPSAQIRGPVPDYVNSPPAGLPRQDTGFQAALGTAHRWDTERSGSEGRNSVRGATAVEGLQASGGRVLSDMSAAPPSHPPSTSSDDVPTHAGQPMSARSATGDGGTLLASDTMAAAGKIQEAFRVASAGGRPPSHSDSSAEEEDTLQGVASVASAVSDGEAALGMGVVGGGGSGLSPQELAAAQAVRIGLENIAKQLHMVYLGTPASRPALTKAVKEDAAISKKALLLATEEFLKWKPEGPPSQWPEDMRQMYADMRPEIVARRDEIYSLLKAKWQLSTLVGLAGDPQVQKVLQRIRAEKPTQES